jgi:hypothetical protein
VVLVNCNETRHSTIMLTRSRRKTHAVIEEKLDPNEVTYKPDNDLMPAWIAVLRFRYMTDLVADGYVSYWEDFRHGWTEEGDSSIYLLQIKYNDSVISARPLHPDLYLSKIRTFLKGKLRLTIHIYPQVAASKQANVLVQGKDCREWVMADFDRLQEVVMMMMDRPSKETIMETWQEVKPLLSLPPCVVADDVDEDERSLSDWSLSPLPGDDTEQVLVLPPVNRDGGAAPPLPPTPPPVWPPSLLAITWYECGDTTVQVSDPDVITPSHPPSPTPPSHSDAATTSPPPIGDQAVISHLQAPASVTPSPPPTPAPAPHSDTTEVTPHTVDGEAVETVQPDTQSVVSHREENKDSDVTTLSGGDPEPNPPAVTTAALLAMFQELRCEFEAYKAATVEKMENQRVQPANAQRVHSQQCCSATDDLRERCAKQEGEINKLNKKCQGLEQSLKQLRKDCQSNRCLQETPPPSSPTKSAITVVTNHGRYKESETGDNRSPSSLAKEQSSPTTDPFHSLPASPSDDTVTKQGDSSPSASAQHHALRLPQVATRLIIGDSNLKDINRRRLNAAGDIHVCTLRGARIETLQQAFSAMSPSSTIKKVVLHVGTNNIAGRQSDNIAVCVAKYSDLLDAVMEKLPAATVAVSALPPLKPWMRSKTARQLNASLKDLCTTKRAVFLPHHALWATDDDGKLYPQVLRDQVHLSQSGLGLFVRETKAFLNGATAQPAKDHPHDNDFKGGKGGKDVRNATASYADALLGLKQSVGADTHEVTTTSSTKSADSTSVPSGSHGSVINTGQNPPQSLNGDGHGQSPVHISNGHSSGGQTPPLARPSGPYGQPPPPFHGGYTLGHHAPSPLFNYPFMPYPHPPPQTHATGPYPSSPQAGHTYGLYPQYTMAGGMPLSPPMYPTQWYPSVSPPIVPVH